MKDRVKIKYWITIIVLENMSNLKKDHTMKIIIPSRIDYDFKHYLLYKCINLILVGVLCSCSTGNYEVFENSDKESDNIGLNISYGVSLNNDTLKLCLTNIGEKPVFLFDSYLNDYEFRMKILEGDAIYRYNSDEDIFKLSFLPLLPYLSYHRGDLIAIGERRITRGLGNTVYSFRPIGVNETICINLPFEEPRMDRWQKDIDVKQFNKWDMKDRMKFEQSDHCLNKTDSPEVFFEIAIYNDTVSLNEYDYYLHEYDFNNKIKKFKTLQIPLTQDIINMIFRN